MAQLYWIAVRLSEALRGVTVDAPDGAAAGSASSNAAAGEAQADADTGGAPHAQP